MEQTPSPQNTSGLPNPGRRDILRLAIGIPVALVAGESLALASSSIVTATHDLTGLSAGDASIESEVEASCGPEPTQTCVDNFNSGTEQTVMADAASPLLEETLYRAVPSVAKDLAAKGQPVMRQTFLGREKVALT